MEQSFVDPSRYSSNANFESNFERKLRACVAQDNARAAISSALAAPGQARASISSALATTGQARTATSSALCRHRGKPRQPFRAFWSHWAKLDLAYELEKPIWKYKRICLQTHMHTITSISLLQIRAHTCTYGLTFSSCGRNVMAAFDERDRVTVSAACNACTHIFPAQDSHLAATKGPK